MAEKNTETARIAKQQKALITKRYKEFLPIGADPIAVYRHWVQSIFGNARPDESVMYFVLSQAKAAGIDPRVPRQIYALPYNVLNKVTNQWEVRFNIIIGIEGMVTIAERTGAYGGVKSVEYEFETDESGKTDRNKVVSCAVTITKVVQGILVDSTQIVYFDEYFVAGTTNKQGKYNPSMWETKGKTMIKKVALAHCFRASFSACAGLYIDEEMQRGETIEGRVVDPLPDIQKRIKDARTGEELQEVLDDLPPEERLHAIPLMQERMKEIGLS